jgi:hypothetical protein
MLTKILLGREPHLSTRLRPRGLQQGQGRLRKGRVRSLARSFRRQAQGGRRGLHGNGIIVQIRKTGKQSKPGGLNSQDESKLRFLDMSRATF